MLTTCYCCVLFRDSEEDDPTYQDHLAFIGSIRWVFYTFRLYFHLYFAIIWLWIASVLALSQNCCRICFTKRYAYSCNLYMSSFKFVFWLLIFVCASCTWIWKTYLLKNWIYAVYCCICPLKSFSCMCCEPEGDWPKFCRFLLDQES